MLKRLFTLSLALAPVAALAQDSIDTSYVDSIVNAVATWVSALVPILIGLAVVALFYGLVKYIWGGADDKDNGKRIMIWGVIAIAVMVSVWGLVGLLQDFTGINSTQTILPPSVPEVSI